MPKGVEHQAGAQAYAGVLQVSRSPMPKGVEHFVLLFASSTILEVSRSPMPKGVEHHLQAGTVASAVSEPISDAERR